MRFKFCPVCGNVLSNKNIECEGSVPFCLKCDKLYIPQSSPCVFAVIKYLDKILLIKQSYISTNYVLVAGHVKQMMSAEQAIEEEILEEVGLNISKVLYINSYYHQKTDHLMLGFYVEAYGTVRLNNEVASYDLFDKDEAILKLSESKSAKYLLKDIISRGIL